MFTSIIKRYPTPKGIKTAITWKPLLLDKYYVTTFPIPDAATLNVNFKWKFESQKNEFVLRDWTGIFQHWFLGIQRLTTTVRTSMTLSKSIFLSCPSLSYLELALLSRKEAPTRELLVPGFRDYTFRNTLDLCSKLHMLGAEEATKK